MVLNGKLTAICWMPSIGVLSEWDSKGKNKLTFLDQHILMMPMWHWFIHSLYYISNEIYSQLWH